MYSEFFSFLSTSWDFLNLFCVGLSLWVLQWGQLFLLTQVHADAPDYSITAWTYVCCAKLPFLCKLSCALISLPFFLYASLSACSTPGRVLHTSTVMGYRNKFTQNGKMHLGIVKRFSPTIGIKWELYNAVITQMLFFFLTVYTIYRFLNQPWMVADGSLYPTCCSLRPSHYAMEAQKNKQNVTWRMRNTKRIIRKIMQPYLKYIYSNSFSILKKTRRGS